LAASAATHPSSRAGDSTGLQVLNNIQDGDTFTSNTWDNTGQTITNP
jgi:hypothetical protein